MTTVQIDTDAYVQTRSETTGIDYHASLDAAIGAAEEDKTIWEISFDTIGRSRCRLVTRDNGHTWYFENILDEITILKDTEE